MSGHRLLTLCAAVAIGLCAMAPAGMVAASGVLSGGSAVDIEKGKAIAEDNCASCHGSHGAHGTGPTAPPLSVAAQSVDWTHMPMRQWLAVTHRTVLPVLPLTSEELHYLRLYLMDLSSNAGIEPF